MRRLGFGHRRAWLRHGGHGIDLPVVTQLFLSHRNSIIRGMTIDVNARSLGDNMGTNSPPAHAGSIAATARAHSILRIDSLSSGRREGSDRALPAQASTAFWR